MRLARSTLDMMRKVIELSLRKIAHLYNDGAEEWFSKCIKYKGHKETRIASLLQRHFPLSTIAGYNLAQDKIIYVWDVQRRECAVNAEQERKKQLTKEAALPSRAQHSLKIYLTDYLADDLNSLVSRLTH